MPTILRVGPYRFFFYSLENNEPPHVHVESTDKVAKYWLSPVELGSNHGFRSHELTQVRQLVLDNQDLFLEAWHAHFDRRA
jgi:hypothetical protein